MSIITAAGSLSMTALVGVGCLYTV